MQAQTATQLSTNSIARLNEEIDSLNQTIEVMTEKINNLCGSVNNKEDNGPSPASNGAIETVIARIYSQRVRLQQLYDNLSRAI